MALESEENQSVGWVVGALMLAIAGAGWGFMAADYFQHADPEAMGKRNFFINAVAQLPHFFQVVHYALNNRVWLLGLIAVLEMGAIGLGLFMKKLEKELR